MTTSHSVLIESLEYDIDVMADYGAHGDGVTDDSAHLQAAIDSLGTGGGVIYFPPSHTYLLNSAALTVPRANAAMLYLYGYGATIKLTSSAPRFLALGKIADHDTFQHFRIEGFAIDGNNIGGKYALVIGNYEAGTQLDHLNYADITVKDITLINVPTDSSMVDHCGAVWLTIYQSAGDEATQNTMSNVLISNVHQTGGNWCALLTGTGGAGNAHYNMTIDNATISDCWHDNGLETLVTFGTSSYQIGGKARGGTLTMRDCYGRGSGDNIYEMNAATTGIIENCIAEDSYQYGFYFCNYNEPIDRDAQVVTYTNCEANNVQSNRQFSGFAFGADDYRMNDIILTDCSRTNTVTNSTTGPTNAIKLQNSTIDSITINNFTDTRTNWEVTGTSNQYFNSAQIGPVGPCTVTIDGYTVDWSGAETSSGTVNAQVLYLYGTDMTWDISGLNFDVDISGFATNNIRGVFFEDDSTSSDSMESSTLAWTHMDLADGTQRVVRVEGSDTLTIDGTLAITSGELFINHVEITSNKGTYITVDDATNKAKVTLDGEALP